ncbi:polymorphic toxin type 44 domain-containing protein [Pseudomonas syringae]|uniref:polymorphic toxin type 44 domain-containing protein n=1 Tax=Pseudomonas syringae TaxID=317 RepID=UPI0004030209|nr:polymorphic toxin type 44 domain-containing protein [Pseudomonas syringae]
MIPSARQGDMHLCPLPGHGSTPIVTASSDTLINGMSAARVGDLCACGALIVTGFPAIIINGRPMAHLGSPTSHGGTIISGSLDVGGGFDFGAAAGPAIDFSRLGILRSDGSLDALKLDQLVADPELHEKASAAEALFSPAASSTTKDPVCNHPDQMEELARYIADEMNRNLLHPTVQKLKKLLNYDAAEETRKWMELPWYAQLGAQNNPQTIAAANTAAAMAIWTEKVGQNREWDHKPKILEKFNNDTRHKQGKYSYYYDIWSNIHYGYIGMAAGFSESVLLDGAGLEQIASETLVKAKNPIEKPWPAPSEGIAGLRAWDDDPDRISIGIGISLHRQSPEGAVQASEIMKAVLSVHNDQWGDALRLHTCFDKSIKKSNR